MLLICGVGFFEEKLIEDLYQSKKIIVVEMDQERIGHLRTHFPDVSIIEGDASSIMLWDKIPMKEIDTIVVTFKLAYVSLAVCRIIRDALKSTLPIVALLYEKDKDDEFEPFQCTVVHPMDSAINIIINKLDKNFSRAIDIGQKKGDIIELKVLSKSHLTDRHYGSIKSEKWNLAVIYRNDEIIVPTRKTKILVGDKIILTGDPKILSSLTNVFIKGVPQFPLQYGKNLAVPVTRSFTEMIDTVMLIHAHVRTESLNFFPFGDAVKPDHIINKLKETEIGYETKPAITSVAKYVQDSSDIGMFVLFDLGRDIVGRVRFKDIFKHSQKPVMYIRHHDKMNNLIISLNCDDPIIPMETGMELSRMLRIPYTVVYAALPPYLRSEKENDALKAREKLVNEFSTMFKANIKLHLLEGNPVTCTLDFLKDKQTDLLLLSHKEGDPGTFFKPAVPYLIAKRSQNSFISIPQSDYEL